MEIAMRAGAVARSSGRGIALVFGVLLAAEVGAQTTENAPPATPPSTPSTPRPVQPPVPPEPPLMPPTPNVSAAAESIYAVARPGLLQIRTLVEAAGRQSSIGSGFLVSSDGLAVTNYHVVSQYVLEPKTYRLEFARPDGTQGALKLIAIDVANDVAIVKLEGTALPH